MKVGEKKQFDEMLDREILRLLNVGRLRASQIAEAILASGSESWTIAER